MIRKIFVLFLIFILFINIFNIYKIYANEVEANQESNTIEDNSIINVDILHNDLSAIFSILVFFTVVLLCYFAYKFLNMFFTI